MSGGASRPFLPVLRAMERYLSAPVPARVRIYRELEFDLEELRDRFVAQGLPPEEAARRAVEALVPEGRALRALERQHAPWYWRLTAGTPAARVRLVERALLTLAVAAVVVMAATTLMKTGLLSHGTRFIWPLVIASALLLAAVAARLFQLCVKKDYREAGVGPGVILGLSSVTMAAGFLGMLLEFLSLAGTLEQAPELANALVLGSVLRGSGVLATGLLLGLAGVLAWLLTGLWTGVISVAHREVLGMNRSNQT